MPKEELVGDEANGGNAEPLSPPALTDADVESRIDAIARGVLESNQSRVVTVGHDEVGEIAAGPILTGSNRCQHFLARERGLHALGPRFGCQQRDQCFVVAA